jgi:two-component system sensor histidine kinase/response regulator
MANVLVIDDSSEIRTIVTATLAHFGFAPSEAADGSSGIQKALAELPDVILCDIRMPGLDGYRTLAAIRNEPSIASIPFIFLTGAVEKNDFRRGMVLGADDYLTKPFKPEELLEAVTTRLVRQSEVKSEMFKRADKLRENIVHLLSQELSVPLDGILGLTNQMIRDYSHLPPEAVLANVRHIYESATRINALARSLG